MFSSRHTFYAMASDCAVQLVANSASEFAAFAQAVEGEVVRIERRYSRYRADMLVRLAQRAGLRPGIKLQKAA